ncbi:MAG TPA: hypothetical protein VKZ85_14290, partial [Woeseiaceae bacterium]|nr:hypothetical protein [Woeseiaceae bacterium]
LKRAGRGGISPEDVDSRIRAAVAAAEASAAERIRELEERIGGALLLLESAAAALRNGSKLKASVASSIPSAKPEARESRAPGPRPRRGPRQPASPRDRDQGDTQVGGTPQRMLDAMALLERLGISEPTRENVSGFCTISANTGTFRTYLSQLRRAGLIEDVPGMRVRLTDAGRAAAAPPPSIPSLEDLHRIWFAKLGGTPARMLEEIIACYPEPVSREKLAGAIGISHDTGTFRAYLSQLRRPGLIRDIDRGGDVVATELLFPEGL